MRDMLGIIDRRYGQIEQAFNRMVAVPLDVDALDRYLNHLVGVRGGGRFYHRTAIVPHWCVVALTAAVPLLRLAGRWLPRQRRRAGLCAACGYDLRATADRCPECGTLRGDALAAR